MYVQDQIKFEQFFCPYCGIPLIAKAIYKDFAGKAPHFAIIPQTPHLYECDGRPRGFQSEKSLKLGKKLIKIEMNFPQALVSRRYPKEPKIGEASSRSNITPEIVERRRKAGISKAPLVPQSYALADIVASYWKALRIWQENNPGEPETAWREVDKIRKMMPLRLADKTNYSDGFRSPASILEKPRIYYGRGRISRKGEELVIDYIASNKTNKNTPPFQVRIHLAHFISPGAPEWHKKTIQKNIKLAEVNKVIRWYAYGLPINQDGVMVLRPANMDHIYTEQFNNT